MIIPFHTCSGAECPKCGVFARQTLQPRVRQILRCDLCQHDTMPGIRTCWTCRRRVCRTCAPYMSEGRYVLDTQVMCAECSASQHRRYAFVDSRGFPVDRMPDILLPSTTVIVVHHAHLEDGPPWEVLCHLRQDNAHWGFLGGSQNIGESLQACAIRETQEESGLNIRLIGAVAIDSDPSQYGLCVYGDNIIQFANITFVATWETGNLQISKESIDLRWLSTDALPSPFLPAHLWRLKAAFATVEKGFFIPVR